MNGFARSLLDYLEQPIEMRIEETLAILSIRLLGVDAGNTRYSFRIEREHSTSIVRKPLAGCRAFVNARTFSGFESEPLSWSCEVAAKSLIALKGAGAFGSLRGLEAVCQKYVTTEK